MPYEITNSLRSTSIIRAVDAGTYTISLANLSASAAESVLSAAIKRVTWSTNGSISISRNGVNLLALHTAGDMRFSDSGHVIANNSTQSIVVTITTGGTAVLEISKDCSYSPSLVA